MTPARRSYYFAHPALESIRVYREAIRGYSSDELEDIYYHIDVLREPVRYRLVQMEMERRGLHPTPDSHPTAASVPWIDRLPGFGNRPTVRFVYLTSALFLVTLSAVTPMLAAIWVFAVLWRFQGIQASLVYIALAPIVISAALGVGLKAGGMRWRSVAVPAALIASIWVFCRSGAVRAILDPLFQAGGGSGGLMSGW